MITEIPSYILSQYLWYNGIIQVDNPSVYFLRFSQKISSMLCNLLVTVDPLSYGMNLREYTYMKALIFNGYNSVLDRNLLPKKTMKMLLILPFVTIA